ncbi:MAG: ATP-binding protein [Atopobiaceae bacterium]|nr:ATP-binding protein [Atopobiaceae bacterium]
MYERKIMAELLAWKNSTSARRKALVVKGLRQVGKTFVVERFARENYENVVFIDFKANDSMKAAFEGDFVVDWMTLDISARMPSARFVPGKTILVFDEVQECANARASVKAFMADGHYDVACTGSLLSIKGYNRKKGRGVPTGSERILYMKPMDFEEFLWAKGVGKDVIGYLGDCLSNRTPVSEATHQAMLRHFHEYICVGGLPAVVERFLVTSDMNAVLQEQRDLIDEYKDDFGKHLDESEHEEVDLELLARINRVFDSIPAQLAKENKKFQYSLLQKKGRSETYQAAIQWLHDAEMVSLCHNLSVPQAPLEGNKVDNVFKLYMQDTGLFTAMLEQGTAAEILSGNLGMYKGAIYENIVADAFSKMSRELYYFRKDSGLEIDFVTRMGGETWLVEVKATTGNAKSLKTVMGHQDIYGPCRACKLGAYNIGEANGVLTLPYYLAFMLR